MTLDDPAREAQRQQEPERRLEADCRKLVEGLPVSVDPNFVPILRLIDEGVITADDVLSGVRQAVAKNVRARTWATFENFIRRVAKDRLERYGPAPPGAACVVRLDRRRPSNPDLGIGRIGGGQATIAEIISERAQA
jgi:hypothetical protein